MLPDIVVLGNTNGGLFKSLVACPRIASSITAVITHGYCGLATLAQSYGLPTKIFSSSKTPSEFSDYVSTLYTGNQSIVFIIFYTRILSGSLLTRFEGRIVNSHPSLLPLFPGMDGIKKTIASNHRFLGATLHLVNHLVDDGPVLMQAVHPYSCQLSCHTPSSIVYSLQLSMLLQLFKWLIQRPNFMEQLTYSSPVSSDQFSFLPGIFSPNLDPDLYQYYNLTNPFPSSH